MAAARSVLSSHSRPCIYQSSMLSRFSGQQLRNLVNTGPGYVIIKGFSLQSSYDEICDRFAAFSERIGPLTGHGTSHVKVWPVKPRGPLNYIPTFSETASEAPLHTDNSWVDRPEEYFALLAIRPAHTGGESIAISVTDILSDLAMTEHGRKTLKILRENHFPFSMPDVFLDEKTRMSIVVAPVIEGLNRWRYRYDVIQAGFQARPDLASPECREAIETVNETVTTMLANAPRFKLESGDILLANNHTVLHARTEFSDPERLLLRTRMVGGGEFFG